MVEQDEPIVAQMRKALIEKIGSSGENLNEEEKKEQLNQLTAMYLIPNEPVDVMIKRIENDFFGDSHAKPSFTDSSKQSVVTTSEPGVV